MEKLDCFGNIIKIGDNVIITGRHRGFWTAIVTKIHPIMIGTNIGNELPYHVMVINSSQAKAFYKDKSIK